MPKFIIDIHLDGYLTKKELNKACKKFIYEQLNYASALKVHTISNKAYTKLTAKKIDKKIKLGPKESFADCFHKAWSTAKKHKGKGVMFESNKDNKELKILSK